MGEFKASALAKRPVALAEGAEVRENMVIETVAESAWKDVKAVKSSAVFADALTGNVVSRDGVEMVDGKPAYISTRLKIERGRITEVEFSSDLGRVNPTYVWNLPPVLTTPVPENERMTREALDALAHRYFQTLTDHKPVVADYDEARCNRFHSGNQITNVSRNIVEGDGARTCVTSNAGNKPWGPALEQRFPVIDVEHGIVIGMTLLMFPNQVMYVSEVFKVEQGRITHIDNIGLVRPGLEHTTGFGTSRLRTGVTNGERPDLDSSRCSRRDVLTRVVGTGVAMVLKPSTMWGISEIAPMVADIVRTTIGIDAHNHIDVALSAADRPGPALDLGGETTRSGLSAI